MGLRGTRTKRRKTTIRVGAGIFYTGLDNGITSDTIRLRWISPAAIHHHAAGLFRNDPGCADRSNHAPADDPHQGRRFERSLQLHSTVSYERPLPLKLVGSVGYTWTRGVHLLRTRNINAPNSRTGNSRDPVLPFPGQGPILQFESTGLSTRHELRSNVRTGFSRNFTLFGGYTLASTSSDTDSAYTAPSNPFDLSTEFGRAAWRFATQHICRRLLPAAVGIFESSRSLMRGQGDRSTSRPALITTAISASQIVRRLQVG